jgi:hypothetical protein
LKKTLEDSEKEKKSIEKSTLEKKAAENFAKDASETS